VRCWKLLLLISAEWVFCTSQLHQCHVPPFLWPAGTDSCSLPDTFLTAWLFLSLTLQLCLVESPPSASVSASAGTDEYSLVDALKSGKITKPVVAWVR
jgi:hypothetical protein